MKVCNRVIDKKGVRKYNSAVTFTSKPVSTKTVCKPVRIVSYNKPVIFSPVDKSFHASNISIS